VLLILEEFFKITIKVFFIKVIIVKGRLTRKDFVGFMELLAFENLSRIGFLLR